MRELLSEKGSIYIHLDYHVGHYVKIVLDDIFSKNNFQREIVWNGGSVSGFKSQVEGWVRQHDMILYYSKTDDFIFNKFYLPYKDEYINKMFQKDNNGKLFR